MFSGLIEDVGSIEAFELRRESAVLTVGTRLVGSGLAPGASIAVNGACLTVVKRGKKSFTVDVSPETLERTGLSTLRRGTPVNLERAMRLSDRLGGHFVTGHVDGVANVQSIDKQGDFTLFTFRLSPQLGSLLVYKGSVAVDGISLTINACKSNSFSVAIIPFTLRHTNLRARRVGDKVNIETDLIGKYVQQFMKQRAPRRPQRILRR